MSPEFSTKKALVATKKVAGGKLLRVKAHIDPEHGVVESVQLTGDFFLHPEEVIGVLEKSLSGLPVDPHAVSADRALDRALFLEKLQAAIQESRAELIGFSAEDIVDTLMEAIAGAMRESSEKLSLPEA